MQRLTLVALALVVAAPAARAATPAEVLCASYKDAIAKQSDRAKREQMIRSLPRGCVIAAPEHRPAPARPAPRPAPEPRPAPAPKPTERPAWPSEPPIQPSPSPTTMTSGGVTIEQARENGNKANQKRKYGDAMRWYKMAADAGDPVAETAVGDLYFNGRGVRTDFGEAMNWYRRAAAKGNATAEEGVGSLYARGQGVEKDYATAMKWFRWAAARGNVDAMNWIGYLYTNGLGVPKDPTEAQNWYARARSGR